MENITEAVVEEEKNPKFFDDYEMATRDESEFLADVMDTEEHSRWMPGIISKKISLSAIDAELKALEIAKATSLDYEQLRETSSDTGSKLILNYAGISWCVNSAANETLNEVARLRGYSLNDLRQLCPDKLAENYNNSLRVSTGTSILLERFGKIAALHSDAQYCVMPMPELLDVTEESLYAQFGTPKFVRGYHSHSITSATWLLPEKKDEMLDAYRETMKEAISDLHISNFCPAVMFTSSDTSGAAATLWPMFESSKSYFPICYPVKVRHRKFGEHFGIELFEENANELFARFVQANEKLKELANVEIRHPENCVLRLGKKLLIPKKYLERAREDILNIVDDYHPYVSVHDIYLSMVTILEEAYDNEAGQREILNLQEAICRILKMDLKQYDLGGEVSF